MVVEHDVVGARNAHHKIATGDAQQGQQNIHVVLVGFGMVGVANVTAHGQAKQLGAEVVFKAGPHDLLAVE